MGEMKPVPLGFTEVENLLALGVIWALFLPNYLLTFSLSLLYLVAGISQKVREYRVPSRAVPSKKRLF